MNKPKWLSALSFVFGACGHEAPAAHEQAMETSQPAMTEAAGSAPEAPAKPAEPAPEKSAAPAATPAAGSGAPSMAPSVESAPTTNDWRSLLEGAWELQPGTEGYRCVRLTATEDLYIKEFQPIAPLGTHHTLLSVNEKPTGPDGVSECTAADNGHTTLLGSGVGENYSAGELPEGVAYKVAKGSQLNLNLHLFNVGDNLLKGVSGTRVRTTTADKVKQYAETILAGSVMLSIPPGRSTSKGSCTLKSDTTVFAVSPHMHQLGVQLKATAKHGNGQPVVLYDGPYDFYEQRQYTANQLELSAGDTIQVDCTYQNDSDRTVKFGESSLDEMCFIGLYRYPIGSDGLICVR